MKNSEKRAMILERLAGAVQDAASVTRQEILTALGGSELNFPAWIKPYKTGRGTYNLQKILKRPSNSLRKEIAEESEFVMADTVSAAGPVEQKSAIGNKQHIDTVKIDREVSFVPKLFKGYVPFGHFADIKQIITSGMFYTFFVSGLSGNGKTLMIEEICARAKRELVRANITIETDEDDLIGGFRLINGETIWQDGPVITAMKRGALLLLDEVDLGSHKLMCLQPILEGKPVYLKKINEIVYPQPGFNICATANTKGRGSADGKFVGTMIMNEAFLERFSITFDQEYPATSVEAEILTGALKNNGLQDEDFVNCLTQWSEKIRKMYVEQAITEMISTRRLVHIVNAYSIFGQDRDKAVKLCLNRFDEETAKTMFEFYTKIDKSIMEEREKKHKEAEEKERLAKLNAERKARGEEPVPEFKPENKADEKAALDLDDDFPF